MSARADPRGGRSAMVVPTATNSCGAILGLNYLCMSHHQRLICMAAVAVAFLLFTISCEREIRVRVAEPMSWECVPEHYMPAYPEAQPVRFRFVEDTHYEEVVSGRGLCDQLKNGGKPVVTVEFELWGDKVRGLRGWNEIAV